MTKLALALYESENFMGLSTHVLDTMHGCPAKGMFVSLFAQGSSGYELVKSVVLNADGRNPDGLLYEHSALCVGLYRLSFGVKDYFKSRGVALKEPTFLDIVSLDFGVANPQEHYHVPLLVSPWSYSTYRGS